jgi:hypothetical protein
VVTAAP